ESGANPPTRLGEAVLLPGEDGLHSAAIDPVGGYFYTGTANSPGDVIKVSLGTGVTPPSRIGAVTLDPGEDRILCAVMDPLHGYAYFGTYTVPGIVVKVDPGAGANPPTRVGAANTFVGDEYRFWSAVIDPPSGYVFFGSAGVP